MALAPSRPFTLTAQERPERLAGMRGQSTPLKTLGATPFLGRLFLPEEDKPGKPPAVILSILSYRFWQHQFHSDRNIVGQTAMLDGHPFTIVGVLPRDFMLNAEVMPSEEPLDKMDVFLPLALVAQGYSARNASTGSTPAARREGR